MRTRNENTDENTNENIIVNGTDARTWAETCADMGYAVTTDGLPLIGISPDEGDGFLVPVPEPKGFDTFEPSMRRAIGRAMLADALRVGQAKVKAEKAPTLATAIDAVTSVMNGTYKPSRDRSLDVLEREADRAFAALIREKVLAAKPDATEATIEKTRKDWLDKAEGKAKLTEFRDAILASGTYTVSRKGRGKAETVTIDSL